jgi:hypothetical protein
MALLPGNQWTDLRNAWNRFRVRTDQGLCDRTLARLRDIHTLSGAGDS